MAIVNPLTLVNKWADPIYGASVAQGEAARREAYNNSKIAKQNAANEEAAAGIEQQRGMLEAEKRARLLASDVGSTYANFAGNGLAVDGGSSSGDTLSDILRTTTSESAADISTINDNARLNAWSHLQNAANLRAEAKAMQKGGDASLEQAELNGFISSAMFAAAVVSTVFTAGAAAPAWASIAGAIGTGIGLAGSAATQYSNYRQAQAAREASNQEANALNEEAKRDEAAAGIEQVKGIQDQERRQRILANDVGSVYANFAGNGLAVDGGGGDTLTKVVESTAGEAAYDVNIIKANTAMNVWSYQNRAAMKRTQARAVRAAGRNAYRSAMIRMGVDVGKQVGMSLAGFNWRGPSGKPTANLAMDTTRGLKSNTGFGATNSWDGTVGAAMFA
ncbi:MAG: hypothetical protein MJZ81_07630 [Bacteroidales bacterium]|nr:hypothetical protein [Bacteroidales bacterium]